MKVQKGTTCYAGLLRASASFGQDLLQKRILQYFSSSAALGSLLYYEQELKCHMHKQINLASIQDISPGGIVVSVAAVAVHPCPCCCRCCHKLERTARRPRVRKTQFMKCTLLCFRKYLEKSRIRETNHLSTDADSSTDAIGGWTKNTPKPDFFKKRKKSPKL